MSSSKESTSKHSFKGDDKLDSDEDMQVDDSVTVLEKIAKIYAERLLCDITLSVSGTNYPAHRLILCASSDVFQVMLMSPSWSESQETTVVLQEDPQCARVFPDFLKYLYTGRIHINHLTVLPLLTLADKYNVKDLISLSLDYMLKHLVSSVKHGQLVSWLQYTLYCGHEAVSTACLNFVKYNFEMVAAGEDFGSMETDVLVLFLQASDLVVYHEMALFQCVTCWLGEQEVRLQQPNENGDRSSNWSLCFASLVSEVMSHIRFPMLQPIQVAQLLLSPLVIRFNNFFFEKMADAMSFHTRANDDRMQRLKSTPNGRLSLTPRLYTVETWGAMLAIDDFFNFPTYGVRTLLFSSPASLATDREPTMDWSVDLFPKGVWFKKLYLISYYGMIELPENIIQTVRLSVSSRTNQKCRISIGILLYNIKDGVEYVRSVVHKNFHFTAEERVLNVDNLVPYNHLNDPSGYGPNGSASSYMAGSKMDSFKIHVILLPADSELL
ncbi:BTB POZ domain containing [Chamberlinius hualienensis]